VSRILNNKMPMPISAATIERVRQAARDMNYSPNVAARALVTRRSKTIGLFSSEMTDPHFAQMLESVDETCRGLGYHLAVSSGMRSIAEPGRVDGLLLLASPDREELQALSVGLPTIYVWHTNEPVTNCIGWSDFDGAYKAGQYLSDLGHRNVAILYGHCDDERPAPQKLAGFLKVMEKVGGSVSNCWSRAASSLLEDQFETGYELTRRLLNEDGKVTAIFARNDLLALGALKAIRERGLSVPGDISVISYNDTIHARCSEPTLTSVRTPIAQAGALAAQQLIQTVESGDRVFPGIVLPTTIIERDSCRSI
jgi:DNA-binding LacI/PurR family transcriptional regulator